jgi:hypothetical protein
MNKMQITNGESRQYETDPSGIEDRPLDDEQRRDAMMRHAIARATPDMLPPEMRAELGPKAMEMLSRICDTARRLGRFPRGEELPKDYWKPLRAKGLNVRACLRPMGLTLADSPKDERAVSKRAKKGKKGVSDWKNRSAYWRTGKKYKALSRGEAPSQNPGND